MSTYISATTILLIGLVTFPTEGSAPDFSFYPTNDVVDVKQDAYVSFQLKDPPENHDVTGSIRYYDRHGYNYKDEDLDTKTWEHNQALTMQRLDAKGYFCSTWAEDNSTTIEYVCRVARNNATANVSKLIFHMTYKLLEGTTRTYNATSIAVFEKLSIGSTHSTDIPGTSTTMVGINYGLLSTTNNSAISTVFSQTPIMYVLIAITIIPMLH